MPKVYELSSMSVIYLEAYLELCSLDSRAREQTISGGERGRCGSPPGPPPTDCEDAHESQDEAAEAEGVASLHAGLEGRGFSGSVANLETIYRETMVVMDLGWVDLTLEYSTILLGSS